MGQSIYVWDRDRPGSKALIRRQLVAHVGIKKAKAIGQREHGRYLIVCFLEGATIAQGEISHAHAKTNIALGLLLDAIVASIPGSPRVPINNFVLPDGEAVINQVIKEQMEEVAKLAIAS